MLSPKRLILVLLTAATCLFCQNTYCSPLIEDFRAHHQEFLRLATGGGKDIELRYLFEPDHNFEDSEGANLSLNEFSFEAEIPLILSRDFFIRTLLYTGGSVYDLHDVTILGDELNSQTLYKNQLGVGFGYFTSDSLLLTGMLTPGVFSTFNSKLHADQLNLYGEFFLVYRVSSQWQLITGVVSDQLFEDIKIYPAAAARYRSSDEKIHIKLSPPVEARVGYQLTQTLQLYSGFFLTGDRYRVHLTQNESEFDLRVQDKRLGVGVLKYLTAHWNISFEAGVALTKTFKFKLGDGESLPGSNTNSTFYAFLSLGYAL